MKPEIKELWLKALRSGEYKQAKNYLRRNDQFCCLGVLCDLHAKAGLGFWDNDGGYLHEDKVLPRTIQEWAGLNTSEPEAEGRTLSGLNDDGVDFNEIADIIERGL